MLKNKIRRAILETKEKKEIKVITENIVKERLMFIFENENNIKYFNRLPKSKQEKLSFLVLSEMSEMYSVGLINEGFGFMDIFNQLFGNIFARTGVETIAEPLINKLLTSIGFKKDGILKKTIVSILTTNPAELAKAMGDCKLMTKLLAESFTEGLVMVLQDQTDKDGFIYDYIRNFLGGKLKNTGLVKDIEDAIGDKICNLFGNFTNNAKSIQNAVESQKQGI